MLDDLSQYDPLYLPQVVNKGHPLNQGRLAWWIVLPGLDGGQFWYDAMGIYDGTLNSLAAGFGWVSGATRPGGWGQMSFDGTNGRVKILSTQTIPAFTLTAFTFACWIKSTDTAAMILSSLNATNGYEWALGQGSTTNPGIPSFWNGAWVSANTSVADGAWHRIVVSHPAGGPANFYLDGKADGSVASGNPNAPSSDVWLGFRPSSGSTNTRLAGSLDDVSIWLRALSSSEVEGDYTLSRLGYPGVLRRVSDTLDMQAATVVAAQPWTPWPQMAPILAQ